MTGTYDFTGRHALVTGASSGIGRSTALGFAMAGGTVLATGRREYALDSLSSEAAENRIKTIPGDVTDWAFLDELAAEAGEVDVLVNCAGTLKHAPFLESDPNDWDHLFRTNVLSMMRLCHSVGRGMAARRRGHIINTSSILARAVYPMTTAYAASKHAVRAMTRGLRIELQPVNVRVTEIAMGLTGTDVLREIVHPAARHAYASRMYEPMTAEEVAEAILGAAAAPPNVCPEVIQLNPMGQL